MGKILFISGIDTDVGKTIATGVLAKQLAAKGHSVITQKMVQTGCTGLSADLQVHRRIQGIDWLPEDLDGTTCPYVFAHPCSPHLAAALEQRKIDDRRITAATAQLAAHYDYVLLEGAGGLAVPYCDNATTLDYITRQGYPVVLVTSAKLGSINHTLLSLAACKMHGIVLDTLIYNHYPCSDEVIKEDTRRYLRAHLTTHFQQAKWLDLAFTEW
ncbi:dethiobiotin synthase [Neisseria iguanae]|uniref:ATP-dependent dethiobiotin synthetase BioD n=1 Tax=Neisseria iguanae TaxID=90242 RepID=A0A2P7TZ90_9NEIS|nr:dethiobiotin synthase [Neisseria iguanae]PSJ80042.1 dethiobiotin synthase [Neisseria iguanae]